MDELKASGDYIMSPDGSTPVYDMGGLIDAIPTVKTDEPTVPATTYDGLITGYDRSGPWGQSTTEEEELISKEAAREALKVSRFGEFWDLPYEQQYILQKEKRILARLELMRDGAQQVLRAFNEARDGLPKIIAILAEKHDTLSHDYSVARLHLDPECADAQRLGGAMERLRMVERWCREGIPWADDAYQRLKEYFRLYQELVATQKTRLDTMKGNIIGAHNAAERGTPWSSDRIEKLPIAAITEDKLKHCYPKIVMIPGPCSFEEYQNWPNDETETIEPAMNIYEGIMVSASHWGLFEGQ